MNILYKLKNIKIKIKIIKFMKIKIIKERIIENIKIKNDYYQFTKIQRLVVNLDLLLLK
jgi:hypothetical protein